jgi:hypothetical protein
MARHSANGMFGHPNSDKLWHTILTFGVAPPLRSGANARTSYFRVSEVHFERKRCYFLIVFDIAL